MTSTIAPTTVETFLALARAAILEQAELTDAERDHLSGIKVTYGAGNGTYRGITFFGAWQRDEISDEHSTTDFIEIAATAQESWVQLAGTLLHELGHSLAGMGAGHSKVWKDECVRLGFVKRPEAAGQRYWLSLFRPALRFALVAIAKRLQDGTPLFRTGSAVTGGTVRPCRAGTGTRGGKSRGTGSGSRLRLWECTDCERPVKVRVASDDFQAHCDRCGSAFVKR